MGEQRVGKELPKDVKDEIRVYMNRDSERGRENKDKISVVLNTLGEAEVGYMANLYKTWSEDGADEEAMGILDRASYALYEGLTSDIDVLHPVITNYEAEEGVVEEVRKQLHDLYKADKEIIHKVVYDRGTVITLGDAYLSHVEDVVNVVPPYVYTDYVLDGDFDKFSKNIEVCYHSKGYNVKRGEEYFRLMYLSGKDPRQEDVTMGALEIELGEELKMVLKGYIFGNATIKKKVTKSIQLLENRKSSKETYEILSMWDGNLTQLTGGSDLGKAYLGLYAFKYNCYGESKPTKSLIDTVIKLIKMKVKNKEGNITPERANTVYQRVLKDLRLNGLALITVRGKYVIVGKELVVFRGQEETLQVCYKQNHSKITVRDLERVFNG